MSKTKEQIVEELQSLELINDENRARLEALNKVDLEMVLGLADKATEYEAELGKLVAEQDELNAKVMTLETELAKHQPEEKKKKPKPGLKFKFRGEDYKFLDNAPKTLRYGGQTLSQKEVSELGEDDLLQLVAKSSLIQKLKSNGK